MIETLACAKCKNRLVQDNQSLFCKKCRISYHKDKGIWHFFTPNSPSTPNTLNQYENLHKNYYGAPTDGSYEVLAAFAKGNKTLDVACGPGLLEKLVPETVGLDFSLNALKKAKQAGAKYLIWADAHNLPFKKNAFDLAVCAGSLEHFENPQKAIREMVRVSKIQVLTVHKTLPVLFPNIFHAVFSKIFNIAHQPIEKPINSGFVEKMVKNAGSKVIFKGVWTLPVNYGRVITWLPELKSIPSCSFIISIKK